LGADANASRLTIRRPNTRKTGKNAAFFYLRRIVNFSFELFLFFLPTVAPDHAPQIIGAFESQFDRLMPAIPETPS
jgi:hypothetical protein